jgi:all-trans-retinol dehydrogenase (NAD+)
MSSAVNIRSLMAGPSRVALNPFITASLLFLLTRGPPTIRNRILDTFTSLRDPRTLARAVKSLKWLLAIGVAGTANRTLNELALNSWRAKSDKARWEWNQEVAVVTGGCSGLGELLVQRLIAKGVKVAVLDIQQLPLSLQGRSNVYFFACDVTNPNAVSSAAKEIAASLGPPSILVNNAGIAQPHTILDTTPEYLQKIFAVNLFSNWHTVKAFLPNMIAKNKGHIVTVASTASYVGVAGMADYCATKASVLAFHEGLCPHRPLHCSADRLAGLNQELRQKYNALNVVTSSIHPNWVRTPLIAPFEKSLHAAGSVILEPQAVVDAIAEQIFKCTGGQLFLPSQSNRVSFLRALPNWVQEMVRGGLAKSILQATS